MWRRFFLLLLLCSVFSVLCFASGVEEYEPGVNASQNPFTMDIFWQAVGIDPEDEERISDFTIFLNACEAETYDEFEDLYLKRGYPSAGVPLAFTAFCAVHDYDMETFGIVNNSVFTRYYGDNISLVYIKPNTEGVTPGYYLGFNTMSPTSGNVSSNELKFNLTEIQAKINNALTDANLETLNKNSNKIVDKILEYYPIFNGALVNLSNFVTNLGGTRNLSLWSYSSFSPGEWTTAIQSSYRSSSFFETLNQWYVSISRGIYQGFDNLDRDLGSWLNGSWSYVWYDPPSAPFGSSSNAVYSGTGLMSLFGYGVARLSSGLSTGFRFVSTSLLGSAPSVFNVTSYDADGNPVFTPSDPQQSLAGLLIVSLQALQQDTAALRFVLADEDDIRLKASQKENQDSFEDNFTGNGSAAVKPGDIADIGSWAEDIQDILSSNPASGADFFGQLTASGNYDFFSQQTQNSLDAVSNSSAVVLSDKDLMEDWLEDYTFDEDGFASLTDVSYFDFSSFLGGVSK